MKCMYAWLCYKIHGGVQVHNVGVEGKYAIGDDYGFFCTCITGSTKFPNSNPFLNISVYRNAPSLIKIHKEV